MNHAVYLKALQALSMTFRALTEDDAEAYRALRMKALETEGRWFTADLKQEASQTFEEWKAICAETEKSVIFAAFLDGHLVGTTGIQEYSRGIARWKSTYIEPTLRCTGIAHTLFEMCTDWCAENNFKEAVFTIRADNLRSRTIQEKNGAIRIGEELMRFADGSFAPVFWYKKKLTTEKLSKRSQTITPIKETEGRVAVA